MGDVQRILVERLLGEKISLHGICRAVGVSLRWLMGFAQFLAVCRASLLAEKLRISSPLSSQSLEITGALSRPLCACIYQLQPSTNAEKLSEADMLHSTDTPCAHALRTRHEDCDARDVASACAWPPVLLWGHSMRLHGSQRSCNVWEAHRRQSVCHLSRHRSSLYRRPGNGICNRDGENAA